MNVRIFRVKLLLGILVSVLIGWLANTSWDTHGHPLSLLFFIAIIGSFISTGSFTIMFIVSFIVGKNEKNT